MTHPAFPIELNPELIDAYVQDGFVTTENVLSDAELRNYSDAVDLVSSPHCYVINLLAELAILSVSIAHLLIALISSNGITSCAM